MVRLCFRTQNSADHVQTEKGFLIKYLVLNGTYKGGSIDYY